MNFLHRILRKMDLLWQMMLAHSFRLTGGKMFIVAYHWHRDILLSAEEMFAVGTAIRSHPGRFLVFGAGHDSIFWALLNRGHPTLFLESDSYWLKRMHRGWKNLDLQPVIYTTRLTDLRMPEANDIPPPALDLPEAVRGRKWDLILVDAPQGWGDGPGRIQSIFEASRLVAGNGRIFVHDCDREGEQYLTGRYLRHFQCRKFNHRLWIFQK